MMTSNHGLTRNHEFLPDERVNNLLTEKLHTDNDVHGGSGTIVSSPEIGPAYQSDTDLEQGIEKLPEISSTISQKVGGAGDIQDHEEYPTRDSYSDLAQISTIWSCNYLAITARRTFSIEEILMEDGGFVD